MTAITPDELMQLALDEARRGLDRGQFPFGCAIALDGDVAVGSDCERETTDVTAHAEIVALRRANAEWGRLYLDGAMVATTCEPCVMCAGALHWAKAGTVWYGASVEDSRAAGLSKLTVSFSDLVRMGEMNVQLVPGFRRDECLELMYRWDADAARRAAP
jgi:guanine deaminase